MVAVAREFRVPGAGGLLQPNLFVPDADVQCRIKSILDDGIRDPHWNDIRATMIQTSCAFFAREMLRGPPEAPYNGHFLLADHHTLWDTVVSRYKRFCIQCPRDHGKTYFFDFAYPIWQAMRIPNGSGFIFSGTSTQAERILDDIKHEIETNPALQWLYPRDPGRRWSSSFIKLANGHKIYARGYGTKVRGGHPNWIIVDDGINDEAAYSELTRTKQIEYYYTAISNMIIPTGQLGVVGTPMHQHDLYGDLKKNKAYSYCKLSAINDDGEPLWPARYSLKRLRDKEQEIGPIRFAREFRCEPISDEMSIFPKKLFMGDPTEQPLVKLGMPLEWYLERDITPFMGVDFAISSNVAADYTVIFLMGVDPQGNRWIIDIIRERGLPYQHQLSLINTYGRKYQVQLAVLESNQCQQIFGDELIRTTDLPIRKYTTGKEKNSLERGVPSLRVLLENGKFRIPRGDARSVRETDIWIEEMNNFTFLNGKLQSVGGHDDTVMGLYLCNIGISQGAFGFSFGADDLPDSQVNNADDADEDSLDEFGMPVIVVPRLLRKGA